MDKAVELDEQVIERLKKLGGDGFLAELLDLFAENAPAKLQEALDADKRGDLTQMERAVHSLKSSAGNLGAFQLMELCNRIETLAAEGQAGQTSPLVSELQAAYERVDSRLKAIRSSGG